ncbi:MAG TPA: alpha/beta hydrolase [Pararhizobium sp.]|uniref:alpha/beta hydrolase n=1 Tax=Pararhizobium sp. TaxID=1977563 RepID=UPI002C61B22B|nr:alpha/beta hydrolase [Pararhizobium sp.]HTO31319.1 alpha/beta hydrolase [Pararhizobium sp.]
MTADFEAIASTRDIDDWLASREAAFSDIRPGLAKEIVWADPAAKNRTPLAIIYIHGFSASKGEVRPLPDQIAGTLGANLFYTRLAGHARNADAMAQATVEDWQNDMVEALAIGARLGERTLIIATSTGASLATWALAQPALSGHVAGVVFLAPNYRIKGRGAFLLTAPLAAMSARLILGPRRSFIPRNDLHAAYWTTNYPVGALLPMARLVRIVSALPFEKITTPALFLHSPRDQVIDPNRTRVVTERWGGPATLLDPGDIGDPHGHVIAGDALSPQTTELLVAVILNWFRKVDQRAEII